VAAVIVELLRGPGTIGRTLDLTSGHDTVIDAVRAAAQSG
jgi:hypothetical protein